MKKRGLRADEYRILHKQWMILGIIAVSAIICISNLSDILTGQPDLTVDQMIVQTTESGWFRNLLFSASAIPFVCSYCDDVEHKYREMMVMRMGVQSYAWSKFWYNALASFLASFLGFLFAAFLGSFFFDMYYYLSYGNMMVYGSVYKVLLAGKFPFLFLLVHVLIFSCGVVLWSSFALLSSTIWQDKLIVLAMPFVASYLAERLTISWPYMFNVDACISGYPIFEENIWGSMIYSISFLLFFSFLCGVLFVWRVEKSVGN